MLAFRCNSQALCLYISGTPGSIFTSLWNVAIEAVGPPILWRAGGNPYSRSSSKGLRADFGSAASTPCRCETPALATRHSEPVVDLAWRRAKNVRTEIVTA